MKTIKNEFIERILVKGKNILDKKTKKRLALNTVTIMLLVPIVSILIYKIFAEPFYVKKMVEKSVIETISHQPELVVETLKQISPNDTVNELTDEERSRILNEVSERINQEKQPIVYSLDNLKQDLLYLKEQPGNSNQNLNFNFQELLDKVQDGTATEQDIHDLLELIDSLKASISSKAEQEDLDNLKKLLEKMQEGAVTGGELTEVKDILGALKEELDKAKNEMNDSLAKSNAELEEKIRQIIIRIDELEIAIEEKHYTKTEIDAKIAEINADIAELNETILVTINNKVEEINNNMSSSNTDLMDELNAVRKELGETITKTKTDLEYNIAKGMAELEEKIRLVISSINELETAIEKRHYTKTEIDAKIAKINTDIVELNDTLLTTINKKVEEINVNMSSSNTDLLNELETVKKNLDETIDKTRADLENKINQISIRIDKLETAIEERHYTKTEIDAKIAEINTDIVELNNTLLTIINKKIEEVNINISTSNNDLLNELKDVKEKLNGIIDKTKADLEDKIKKISGRIDKLEAAIEDKHYTKAEIDNFIREINNAIDDINNNTLVTINTKIDELNNKTIVDINNAINDIRNNTLITINSKIEEIRNEMGSSNTDLTEKIDNILEKIDDLQTSIAGSHYTKVETDALLAVINSTINDLKTAISNNHYTKAEINAMVNTINTAIDDINNNKIVTINNRIGNLGSLSTSNKSNLVGAMNEVFQNVSSGKALIASAITDKGIHTAADATFQQMANNIRGLVTMSTNPSVLFDTQSWTAPNDCIAVCSWAYSWKANDDYNQTATVTLSGVRSWDMGWGGTHDSHWHDYSGSGNVTWQARAGQTYTLSFSSTASDRILTGGWVTRTWIVPGSASRSLNSKKPEGLYIDKIQALEKGGRLWDAVPWKKDDTNKEEIKDSETDRNEQTNEQETKSNEESSAEEITTEEITVEELTTEESVSEEISEELTESGEITPEEEENTEKSTEDFSEEDSTADLN